MKGFNGNYQMNVKKENNTLCTLTYMYPTPTYTTWMLFVVVLSLMCLLAPRYAALV